MGSGAGGRDEREARKVLGLEAGVGLKEVRKRFADLSKQLHPDKVADEEKKLAAKAKWVAVKAAYDLLRELALARPGGGGRRSVSEDRRGKEKERRRESRGRREAEAMAEREKEDRGAGRNPGMAKKKSAFNFPGLNLGGTAFLFPSRDVCHPKAVGGEPEP